MNGKAASAVAVVAAMVLAAGQAVAQEQPGAAAGAVTAQPVAVRRVVVNIPAMTLELLENGDLVKSYRVAVGRRSTPTPTGTFRITQRVKNPGWWGPDRQVIAPGPGNPVGTRWIGLDAKGYGIHGTNAPRSIGQAASAGCVRMKNRDVEDLFERVRPGDEVTILYETAAADGQALPDVYGLAAALAAGATPRTPEPVVAANRLPAGAGAGLGGGL